MTLPRSVAALINARRLEPVPADRTNALARLNRAEEKLDAARRIAAIDVEVAYVTSYDATRIALTAHMLSRGYRVRAIAGAHEAGHHSRGSRGSLISRARLSASIDAAGLARRAAADAR